MELMNCSDLVARIWQRIDELTELKDSIVGEPGQEAYYWRLGGKIEGLRTAVEYIRVTEAKGGVVSNGSE